MFFEMVTLQCISYQTKWVQQRFASKTLRNVTLKISVSHRSKNSGQQNAFYLSKNTVKRILSRRNAAKRMPGSWKRVTHCVSLNILRHGIIVLLRCKNEHIQILVIPSDIWFLFENRMVSICTYFFIFQMLTNRQIFIFLFWSYWTTDKVFIISVQDYSDSCILEFKEFSMKIVPMCSSILSFPSSRKRTD